LAVQTKSILLATVGTAALIPTSQAADMQVGPIAAPVALSWAGFYIGGHLGGASAHNRLEGDPEHQVSFVGGGQIGYNFQKGMFVFGAEADASWLANTEDHLQTNNITGVQKGVSLHWLATVRARGGVAFGNWYTYLTTGVAWGEVQLKLQEPCCNRESSYSQTRLGWVFGGGIQHLLTPNVIVGIEALYIDFGSRDIIVREDEGKSRSIKSQAFIARARVDFRF
jgi:outer membrane immunogenic protein